MTGSLPGIETSRPAATAETLLPCAYRQRPAGERLRNGMPVGHVYRCQHPLVMVTTAERCQVCTHRAERIAPGCPAPVIDALPLIPMPAPTPAPVPPAPARVSTPTPVSPPASPPPRMGRRARLALQNAPLGPQQAADLLVTRDNTPSGLQNLWYGSPLFMVMSGPSLNTLPLEKLNARGIATFAVNNAACVVRPTIWTHVDPCQKFHEAIWRDPGIIKLMPTRFFSHRVRTRHADGRFEELPHEFCKNQPGVFGYQRNSTFDPEIYLTEPTVNWGNNKKSAARNGRPHVLNVMFAALRLAYYLGFRKIFLLGCDFRMDSAKPYAFQEDKHAAGAESNNGTYVKLNLMLGMLAPCFKKAGCEIYNLNPTSGLIAFPKLSFEEALDHARSRIPDHRNTAGWYTKS